MHVQLRDRLHASLLMSLDRSGYLNVAADAPITAMPAADRSLVRTGAWETVWSRLGRRPFRSSWKGRSSTRFRCISGPTPGSCDACGRHPAACFKPRRLPDADSLHRVAGAGSESSQRACGRHGVPSCRWPATAHPLSLLLCAIRDHRAQTEDPEHRERINEQYLINRWKPAAHRLKLLPTQADRASYLACLDATPQAGGADPVGAAYRFFRT